MFFEQRARIRSIKNWPSQGEDSSVNNKERYIESRIPYYQKIFEDAGNQRVWKQSFSHTETDLLSRMMATFEFGARQVYFKVGFQPDQIERIKDYRFKIGRYLDQPFGKSQIETRLNFRPSFMYLIEHGLFRSRGMFFTDIDTLSYMARNTSAPDYTSPLLAFEFFNTSKQLNIFEFCELAGVEEAAHSLYIERHPDTTNDFSVAGVIPFPYNYFSIPIENAALKWKRNYILRFMPHLAEAYLNFERRLELARFDNKLRLE